MKHSECLKAINDAKERLANGEDPKDVFYEVGILSEGFRAVRIKGVGYNFINEKNELLWNDDMWFYDYFRFKNGFARVAVNENNWNFITTKGELIWKDRTLITKCSNFSEGYAVIYSRFGYNYIDTEGEIIWDGSLDGRWFHSASDFRNGMAEIVVSNTDNDDADDYRETCGYIVAENIGKDNMFLFGGMYEWIDSSSFDDNGYAMVRVRNIGYNFIDKKGNYLSKICFDEAGFFHCGWAAVTIDSAKDICSYINTKGEYMLNDINLFSSCDDFKDGYAEVYFNGKHTSSIIDVNGKVQES